MTLLRRVRDWEPRFRLLFPHPTPKVAERLDKRIGRLERWLVRSHAEHDIPPTIDEAQEKLRTTVADLRSLTDLLPPDDYHVRLVVDTNALIDNPDLPPTQACSAVSMSSICYPSSSEKSTISSGPAGPRTFVMVLSGPNGD